MKRTPLKRTRAKPRRAVHPVQPAHRLADGSVVKREYRVGVDLRKLAKGQPCYAGLDGCTSDPATVVLAHLRVGGVSGMGQKPPDVCALPLDFACHAILDGRHNTSLTRDEIMHRILSGYVQWLAYLWNNGYLKT